MNPTHEKLGRKLINDTLNNKYHWIQAIESDKTVQKDITSKDPRVDLFTSFILNLKGDSFRLLATKNRDVLALLIKNDSFNSELYISESTKYELYTIVDNTIRGRMSDLDRYVDNLTNYE